jgi:hypothetical protein
MEKSKAMVREWLRGGHLFAMWRRERLLLRNKALLQWTTTFSRCRGVVDTLRITSRVHENEVEKVK